MNIENQMENKENICSSPIKNIQTKNNNDNQTDCQTKSQTKEMPPQNESNIQENDNQNENKKQITEEYLEQQLEKAKESIRKDNFEAAEDIFSDLMKEAVMFYKDDQHFKMTKYYYYYGDMLLTKQENTSDIFGEVVQKKVNKEEQQQQQQSSSEDEQEEEENEENGAKEQQNDEEKIIQIDTILYQDENVQIREEKVDKKQEEQKEQANNQQKIDDVQLAWENLQVCKKILQKNIEEVKKSSDPNKKEKQRDFLKQIIQVTLRLADLEAWRDSLSDSVDQYTEALNMALEIEDKQYSRYLSSIYFQLGNSLLYENKELCEENALQNFIQSAQILENILSSKLGIPCIELPSYKIAKNEDIKCDHLKASFLDDEISKDLKENLKNLYEKIQDTITQKQDRIQFQKCQEEMKAKMQNQNQFKQTIDPQNVQVKKLGTFGNLKKTNQQENTQQVTNDQQNNNNKQENNQENNKVQEQGEKQDIQQYENIEKKIKYD